MSLADTPPDPGLVADRLALIVRLVIEVVEPVRYATVVAGTVPAKLGTALTVPLFAGSGHTIAILTLYGNDPAPMVSLAARLRTVYGPPLAFGPPPGLTAPGTEQLITGLVRALLVRDRIQQALGVLIARHDLSTSDAYTTLTGQADTAGRSLSAAAADILGSASRLG